MVLGWSIWSCFLFFFSFILYVSTSLPWMYNFFKFLLPNLLPSNLTLQNIMERSRIIHVLKRFFTPRKVHMCLLNFKLVFSEFKELLALQNSNAFYFPSVKKNFFLCRFPSTFIALIFQCLFTWFLKNLTSEQSVWKQHTKNQNPHLVGEKA